MFVLLAEVGVMDGKEGQTNSLKSSTNTKGADRSNATALL